MVTLEKMLRNYEGLDVKYNVGQEQILIKGLINDFKTGGENADIFRKEVIVII
ncbi:MULTISPECIES: hypothetical protein [Bacillus cereus group]|uniref:hypothetical protein n=1 Tax=Bacillus cereus group TaxID=86661 RepID=UPI0015D4A45D|nr:hypothetical protein [Bacillus cereus]